MHPIHNLLLKGRKVGEDSTKITYIMDVLSLEDISLLLSAERKGADNETILQRKLRRDAVSTISADMQLGEFSALDTIKLNSLLERVDGKHRLRAALDAGVPLENVTLQLLKPGHDSLVGKVDTGRVRTANDVGKMMGVAVPHPSVIAAIDLERRNFQQTTNFSKSRQVHASVNFPHLKALTKMKRLGARAGFMAAAIRCLNSDPVSAEKFLLDALLHRKELEKGVLTTPKSSLWAAFLGVYLNTANGKRSSSHDDRKSQAAYVIKCWNGYRSGKPIPSKHQRLENIPDVV